MTGPRPRHLARAPTDFGPPADNYGEPVVGGLRLPSEVAVQLRRGFFSLMPGEDVIPVLKQGTVGYTAAAAMTVVSLTVPQQQSFVFTNAMLRASAGAAGDRVEIGNDQYLIDTDAWFVDLGTRAVGQVEVDYGVTLSVSGYGISLINHWLAEMFDWPVFGRVTNGPTTVTMRTRPSGAAPGTSPTTLTGWLVGFFMPTETVERIMRAVMK